LGWSKGVTTQANPAHPVVEIKDQKSKARCSDVIKKGFERMPHYWLLGEPAEV